METKNAPRKHVAFTSEAALTSDPRDPPIMSIRASRLLEVARQALGRVPRSALVPPGALRPLSARWSVCGLRFRAQDCVQVPGGSPTWSVCRLSSVGSPPIENSTSEHNTQIVCVCLRSRDVPGGVGSRLLPVLPLPTTFRNDFRDNFRNNHRNNFRHDFDINFGNNFGHNFGNMFRFGCDLCNNSGQVSTERSVLVFNNSAQASTERSVLVLKLLPGPLS